MHSGRTFPWKRLRTLLRLCRSFWKRSKTSSISKKRLAAGATDADIRLAKTFGYTNAEIAGNQRERGNGD